MFSLLNSSIELHHRLIYNQNNLFSIFPIRSLIAYKLNTHYLSTSKILVETILDVLVNELITLFVNIDCSECL